MVNQDLNPEIDGLDKTESSNERYSQTGNKQSIFRESIQIPQVSSQTPLDNGNRWQVAYGDFTGDSRRDVLVGMPWNESVAPDAGAAYLFTGPIDPTSNLRLTDADIAFVGETAGEQAGKAVKIIDHNGDGSADIIVESQSMRFIFPHFQLVYGSTPLIRTIRLTKAAVKQEI
jgi:hypothetical protein